MLYDNVSGDIEAQNRMQSSEDVDEEEEPEEWMRVAQMQMAGMVDHDVANLEWDRDADWTITQLRYNESQRIQMQRWVIEKKAEWHSENEEGTIWPIDLVQLECNKMQWNAYRLVQSHFNDTQEGCQHRAPLRLIIYGISGTGKTYVIKALSNLLGRQCLLTATTGMAAQLTNAKTIHSVAALPISNIPSDENELTGQRLQALQNAFEGVKYVVIDEMSMMGQRTFAFVDLRLRQATGALNEFFGGLNVILVGDFGQLPPVGDVPMYVQPNTSSLRQRGYVAYREFTDVVVLERVQRQVGDSATQRRWRDVLWKVRNGEAGRAEWELLKTRAPQRVDMDASWNEAPRLWFNRKKVHEYNMTKLRALGHHVVKIEATHTGGSMAKTASEDVAHGLPAVLYLAVGAEVFLTWNLWANARLVNGTRGVVQDFVFDDDHLPPSLPLAVIVNFPDYAGPPFLEEYPTYVPISVQYAEWRHRTSVLSRTQIPLRMCWAYTIYKSQGQTIEKAVIDLGDKEMMSGATYVALSRLRHLEDGVIAEFPLDHLKQMKKQKRLKDRLEEEERLRGLALITLQSIEDRLGP